MTRDSNAIPLKRCDDLYMSLDTPKGRGVFTHSFIPSGTVIDTCPVLILCRSDAETSSTTLLDSYTYKWPDPAGSKARTQAVVLGLGSMFNHSVREQNVGWTRSVDDQVVVYTALRDVQPGEELCINYGKVWFRDADAEDQSSEEDPEEIFARIDVDDL